MLIVVLNVIETVTEHPCNLVGVFWKLQAIYIYSELGRSADRDILPFFGSLTRHIRIEKTVELKVRMLIRLITVHGRPTLVRIRGAMSPAGCILIVAMLPEEGMDANRGVECYRDGEGELERC